MALTLLTYPVRLSSVATLLGNPRDLGPLFRKSGNPWFIVGVNGRATMGIVVVVKNYCSATVSSDRNSATIT